MVVLLVLFSSILYIYIEYSVEKDMQDILIKQSRFIVANYPDLKNSIEKHKPILKKMLNIDADIIKREDSLEYLSVKFENFTKGKKNYLKGYFLYDGKEKLYLVLTSDVTQKKEFQNKVFRAIVISLLTFMIIVLIYALFLSNMLLSPIKVFSNRLAKMDENILTSIDISKVPVEFKPLAKSINMLVKKIKSFLLYKKELFVGTVTN